MKRGERPRGGKAITPPQMEAVLDHLLKVDAAEGVIKRQGRWPLEALISKRRNAIDQLLLQLATGLRSTEANLIDWTDVSVDGGVMSIRVRKDVAKGGVPRVVLVLVPQVAERLLERRNRTMGKGYVIASPADPGKVWEARNRNKAAAALYQELAEALGIDMMISERSHTWRTTLRSLYDGKAPAAILNSQFGHSEKTAQKHYTDPSDLSGLARAAGLRAVWRTPTSAAGKQPGPPSHPHRSRWQPVPAQRWRSPVEGSTVRG
jgi:integrase